MTWLLGSFVELRAEVGGRPVGTLFNSCYLDSRRQRGVIQPAPRLVMDDWAG